LFSLDALMIRSTAQHCFNRGYAGFKSLELDRSECDARELREPGGLPSRIEIRMSGQALNLLGEHLPYVAGGLHPEAAGPDLSFAHGFVHVGAVVASAHDLAVSLAASVSGAP
jgi:hypothetical protein